MFRSNLLKMLLLMLIIITGLPVFSQVTITQWNFDQQNLNPSTGNGTATTTGGTTTSFATGNPNLYAWSTTTYPEQGLASGTAGVQFNVSTLGYNTIAISWENRNSNTAANRTRLQYTINGTDWLNFEASDANATNINDGNPAGFDNGRYITDAADWYFRTADFSGITSVEQNPLFAVRLVTEFADGTNYAATTTGSSYASNSTIRFENVTFTGIAGTPDPTITSVLMPQYMSGNTPANNRLPFAYRVTFNYLLPNATYRYINTAIVSTDNATSAGSGAMIYVNQNGTFTRSAVGSFTNPGEYGEFTTDANGSYTGWFISEPTTNTRFTPGNQVFMRIRLNDGANGTVASHYLTTAESVNVLAFAEGTGANDGTAVRAVSMAGARNFTMIYDNVSGTGRPLFGTSIESTGIDFSTLLYPDFFRNYVAGVNGAWGGIIPNQNVNGIRCIEERSRTNGSIVSSTTSPDGMWGTTNTVNPAGGITNVLILDLIPNSELTVDPAALNGFSYMMNGGPSVSQSYTLSGSELVGSGNIDVAAPAHYEISADNATWVTSLQVPYADGVVTGQPVSIYVRLKAGLNAGTYTETVVNEGGNAEAVSVTCSGTVMAPSPTLASEVVPQYIQGINGTNQQRVPYAFRLTLNDLVPNATYRYYNQAVLDTDLPDADGSGNVIFANNNGTFTRTESPSMASSYGQFTADAEGSFSGWFITESTGDARFTPGNQLYMRLMLNDGSTGTTVAWRLTSTTAAAVINFGTDTDPDMGTGIRATSPSAAGNFVFLFDNTTGTGRPLYATTIETTGIDYTAAASYTGFYTGEVEGTDGSWGGIIPNILSPGVRRVEERTNNDGTEVSHWLSENGVWGTTDTRNPNGGDVTELVLDLMPVAEPELTVSPSTLSDFTYLEGFGPSLAQSYSLSGANLEGSGTIEVTAPVHYEVSLDGTDFVTSLELEYADGTITGQPVLIYTRLISGLTAGQYYNETIVHNGGGAAEVSVTLEGDVTLPEPAQIGQLILPLYIQGMNGTNNNRVPFAFRATLENLQPNATYRFYNKAVVASDAPDYTGVGNTIFANNDGSFNRTTGTSLGTPGQYGEFTTDNIGNYTGWFMLEPTGNERFTPGNQVFMRIMLNDGNDGSSVAMHLTSAEYSTVLMYETEQDSVQGTSIRGTSNEMAGNFIFLYDTIGDNLRPLYGSSIETTGIEYSLTGVYAPFYGSIVEGVNGSWGGIVPNVNPDGVKMIRVYSNTDRDLLSTYEMPTGIWGITDTRNPSGGVDEVLFIDLTTINVNDVATPDARIYVRNHSIVVEPETNEQYELVVYSLQGQQLLSVSTRGQHVINNNLTAGIYIVSYRTPAGVVSTKLYLR